MAKRLTDTDKWKKEWFRKLPVKMKAAWEYLRDNCDHAGIWPGDFELMSFQLGENVSADECERAFGDRFARLPSGKFYLPSFVEFQYGKELNLKNNTHRSVLQILQKEGVSPAPAQPLGSPCPGARDKEKDKDLDMDLEKEEEPQNALIPQDAPARASPSPEPDFDFEIPDLIACQLEAQAKQVLPEAPPASVPKPVIAPIRRVIPGPWPARATNIPTAMPAPPGECRSPFALPQDGVLPGAEFRRITHGIWGALYRPPELAESPA